MKKEELMSGDIVVTRSGYLGIVIKGGCGDDRIVYQEIGMDDLDLFNDDLTDEADGEDCDIMEVYRGGYSFLDIENDDPTPDWSRDINWHRPTAGERRAREAEQEKQRLQMVEEMRQADEAGQESISIITQCFYGNRAGAVIRREDVKSFIRGYLDPTLFHDSEDVELKTIPVPGSENIVIVYDQTKENKKLNSDLSREAEERRKESGQYPRYYITCSIPELGVELHTRCFACRVNYPT